MDIFDKILGSGKKWYEEIELEMVRRISDDIDVQVDQKMSTDAIRAYSNPAKPDKVVLFIYCEGSREAGNKLLEARKNDVKLQNKIENCVPNYSSIYTEIIGDEVTIGELLVIGKKAFTLKTFVLSKDQLVEIALHMADKKLF
jgi:hypothetical protein